MSMSLEAVLSVWDKVASLYSIYISFMKVPSSSLKKDVFTTEIVHASYISDLYVICEARIYSSLHRLIFVSTLGLDKLCFFYSLLCYSHMLPILFSRWQPQ